MKIVSHRFNSVYSYDRSNLSSGLFEVNGIYRNGIKKFTSPSPVVYNHSTFGEIPIKKNENFYTIYTKTDEIKIFEKEEDLCKNYFVIDANNIGKYYKYFNGMVKSLSVDLNLDVYFNRRDTSNECESSSSSQSSSSSSSSSDGGSGSGSSLSLKDLEEVLYKIKDYKILQSETQEGFVNVNFQVNTDTSKIFDDPNFEGRLPANADIFRNIGELSTYENEEGEELDSLTILHSEFGVANLYEKNWEFSQENFKNLFSENPNFPQNSVFVNDPIILNSFYSFPKKSSVCSLDINFEKRPQLQRNCSSSSGSSSSSNNNSSSSSSSGSNSSSSSDNNEESSSSSSSSDVVSTDALNSEVFKEVAESLSKNNQISILNSNNVNDNSYYFDSQNLGFYSVNVSKSCNEVVSEVGVGILFSPRDIFYIKSENKYLCFVEMEVDVTYDINIRTPFNSTFNLFTTKESSKVNKAGLVLKSSSGSSEEDDYIKSKITIYLDNTENPLEIEVHELKQFEYNIDPGSSDCYTGERSLKIFKNNLDFKIKTWQDEDFGTKIFPPKVQR